LIQTLESPEKRVEDTRREGGRVETNKKKRGHGRRKIKTRTSAKRGEARKKGRTSFSPVDPTHVGKGQKEGRTQDEKVGEEAGGVRGRLARGPVSQEDSAPYLWNGVGLKKETGAESKPKSRR